MTFLNCIVHHVVFIVRSITEYRLYLAYPSNATRWKALFPPCKHSVQECNEQWAVSRTMSLICSPEVDGHFLDGIDQSSMTWSLLLWVWTTLSTLFLSQVHIVGLMYESEGTTFPACGKLKNYTHAAIHSMDMTQTLQSCCTLPTTVSTQWELHGSVRRNTYRPGLLNLGLPKQYWPSSLSVHGFMTGAGFQELANRP